MCQHHAPICVPYLDLASAISPVRKHHNHSAMYTTVDVASDGMCSISSVVYRLSYTCSSTWTPQIKTCLQQQRQFTSTVVHGDVSTLQESTQQLLSAFDTAFVDYMVVDIPNMYRRPQKPVHPELREFCATIRKGGICVPSSMTLQRRAQYEAFSISCTICWYMLEHPTRGDFDDCTHFLSLRDNHVLYGSLDTASVCNAMYVDVQSLVSPSSSDCEDHQHQFQNWEKELDSTLVSEVLDIARGTLVCSGDFWQAVRRLCMAQAPGQSQRFPIQKVVHALDDFITKHQTCTDDHKAKDGRCVNQTCAVLCILRAFLCKAVRPDSSVQVMFKCAWKVGAATILEPSWTMGHFLQKLYT